MKELLYFKNPKDDDDEDDGSDPNKWPDGDKLPETPRPGDDLPVTPRPDDDDDDD